MGPHNSAGFEFEIYTFYWDGTGWVPNPYGYQIVTSFGQGRQTGNFIYDLTNPTEPEPDFTSGVVDDLKALYNGEPFPIYGADFVFD